MSAQSCRCGKPSPNAYLCPDCTRELTHALDQIPALLRELDVSLSRQDAQGDSSGRKGTETPLPYHAGASDLLSAANNTLSTWARHIAGTRGVVVTTRPAEWLRAHIGAVVLDEAAGQLCDDVTLIPDRILDVIDNPEGRIYGGPCLHGECQLDLWITPSSRRVTLCDGYRQDVDGCGHAHDQADRALWLVGTLDTALAPLSELLDALPGLFGMEVPIKTARTWVNRGQLVAHGTDGHGRALYNGGQIIALARRNPLHRKAS